jgi:uncharacterized protein YuzE
MLPMSLRSDNTVYFSYEFRMKITYDAEADALSIVFADTTVTTQHLADGIAADYDAAGCLAGLEILDVRSRVGSDATFRQIIWEGIGNSPAASTVAVA